MLKGAIYGNVYILLLISIFLMVSVFKKNTDLLKVRKVVFSYFIFNFISLYLCNSEIVDTGWDAIILVPISVISCIIFIVTICFINKKIKKSGNADDNEQGTRKYIILCIAPVIIFLVPYLYELYVMNSCDYLLKYNYQNGIIQSEDTYIAIVHNKPVTITLQKNLFSRYGISTKESRYSVVYVYNDDMEISARDSVNNKILTENDSIGKIALDAKERSSAAKGASIVYFSEGKYAIVSLMSEENHGAQLGQYFYYDSTYVKEVSTHGGLESVIYYR
jgi:hypothetical protein